MSAIHIEEKRNRRVNLFSQGTRWVTMIAGAIGLFSCPCQAAAELKTDVPAIVDTAAELPRYKFQPGQEFIYSGLSSFDGSHITRYWVTGTNNDGSWHLIFIGTNYEANLFGYLDLFSDGRRVGKPLKFSEQEAYGAFIPLPADASQVKAGWQFAEDAAKQTSYRVIRPGKPWIIDSTEVGMLQKFYNYHSSNTIYFNQELGLMEKIENRGDYEMRTEKGTKLIHETNVWQLTAHSLLNKTSMAKLVSEADAVAKAQVATDDEIDSVKKGATKAEAAKAAAHRALESTLTRVQNPLLQGVIKFRLEGLDERFGYAQEENARRESLDDKPAATWTTTDLAGQQHCLEDYRGKVVVLDFWFRNCGWCIRSMPQIKALADRFRGQPVVILGMNVDKEDKDAQYVVDKLQLNYPTLHGKDIEKNYGVQGCPTFIVIDQKGIVRVRHAGYSPTLREDMGKTISSLLSENK
jgi:thiol-disulfide isomerase/thioredoxin